MNERLRWFVPPIVVLAARNAANAWRQRRGVPAQSSGTPELLRWCTIQRGPLEGRLLYMNPEAHAYQGDMLNGTFDQFLFDYIDRTSWRGKVIYDVGAHVGYHTLNFAQRVDLEGRVFSFEPHPLHLERIKMNLSRNADLAARVTLLPVAASDSTGQREFFCTDSVEEGGSSASFIEGASTPFPRSSYAQYRPITVEAARLDDLVAAGRCDPPDLLKIDVEGAESLVIGGALETVRNHKPRMVIEVHSMSNMLYLTTHLLPLGYVFSLLQEEERRCFVALELRS